MDNFPQSNGLPAYVTANDVKTRPGKVIPYREALRLILSSMATKRLPESIRSELPAIVSHWLHAPKEAPLLLAKKTGKKWRALLSGYVAINPDNLARLKLHRVNPRLGFKLDHGDIPLPPVRHPTFTFIDLFAGIGGFRVALQNLGGKCLFSSELDLTAKQTYFSNFGEIPFGDIHKFTAKNIPDKWIAKCIPDHDIMAAGFPCQPFSKAGISARIALGQKHGFSCETHGALFFDVVRIAKVKKPKAIFLENVKNLHTHDGGRTFQIIRDVIEQELGYSFSSHIIDASPMVPQRRLRCYIVCLRDPKVTFSFPSIKGRPRPLISILEASPPDRYTISNRLWNGHQERTKRNIDRGTGFKAYEADLCKPANTLVARYFKDGKECLIPQKGKNPRKLTPRECARLQGFPEEFIPHCLPQPAYRQFGNSVAIPVVERIAEQILDQYL